jgi:hypothetical protein
MARKTRSLWMAAMITLAAGVGSASASSLAVSSANPLAAPQLADNYTGTIGYQFTVPSSGPIFAIDALGVYDNQNLPASSLQNSYSPVDSSNDGVDDGLLANHTVYIFDISVSTAVPVASTTVTAGSVGSAATANFAFASLAAPLPLIPGNTYEIAEDIVEDDGDYWLFDPSPTYSTDFTNYVGAYGGSDSYLGNLGGQYAGPNFEYSTVPEPVSIALLAGAPMMLLARRRRLWTMPANG